MKTVCATHAHLESIFQSNLAAIIENIRQNISQTRP